MAGAVLVDRVLLVDHGAVRSRRSVFDDCGRGENGSAGTARPLRRGGGAAQSAAATAPSARLSAFGQQRSTRRISAPIESDDAAGAERDRAAGAHRECRFSRQQIEAGDRVRRRRRPPGSIRAKKRKTPWSLSNAMPVSQNNDADALKCGGFETANGRRRCEPRSGGLTMPFERLALGARSRQHSH